MRYLLRGSLCLASFGGAFAQSAPGRVMPAPDPVVWRVKAIVAEPEKMFRASVRAEVAPGWHMYAMYEPDGGPVPTEFTIPEGSGVDLVSVGADRPARSQEGLTGSWVSAYFGFAEFRLRLRLSSEAVTRSLEVPIEVKYQACDDHRCLPPQKDRLWIQLNGRSTAHQH